MILNKALLIKGLVGTTSALGIGTGAYFGRDHISELFRTNKGNNTPEAQEDQQQDQQPQEISETELIKKVGLNCKTPSTAGTECTKLTTEGAEKISVKQGEESGEKFEIDTLPSSSGSGKIKLYKLEGDSTDYNKNLKFVIEDGDITLTNQSKKLEQFETYEIKEEGSGDTKKWYLTRKTKAANEIKKALGLPDTCSLPDSTSTSSTPTCTIESTAINNIKFDGKGDTTTNSSSSTLELTITKVENSDTTTYPLGYKFSFKTTGSGNITVSTTSPNTPITFRPNSPVDFKIKKEGSNSLKLEKDLTLNTLLSEVGLTTCTTTNQDCTISTDGLNVKQGDNNKEKAKTKDTSASGNGKIKLSSSNDTDYNKSFKFVIEDGDISFGSSTGNTISKLEQFETYEIKKEDSSSDWYLTRKTKAIDEKKKLLGLPADESCKLPSSNSDTKTCSNITEEQLKAIKFEGKNSNSDTTMDSNGSSVTLKITKTDNNTTYPNGGYKFVFETTQSNITIPKEGSGNIYIKKNTNTEFKIKKTENKLTLEKAWTVDTLAGKINLKTCTTNGQKQCDFGDKINLFIGDSNKYEDETIKDECKGKKITFEEDQEGYNQGFKFTVEEDITLGSDDNKKIENKNASGSPSYEIKEIDNKWYLSKVTPASSV